MTLRGAATVPPRPTWTSRPGSPSTPPGTCSSPIRRTSGGQAQAELDKAAASAGDRVTAVQGDVCVPADLDRILRSRPVREGRLDILIANDAILGPAPLAQLTEGMIDRQLDVNIKGAILTVQKALPPLADSSSIILIGSAMAGKGIPGQSVHTATKAAVRNLARGWAAEPDDIASVITFLASPDSAYINCADIPADGGMTQI